MASVRSRALRLGALLVAMLPESVAAGARFVQGAPGDSVTVRAGERYRAGALGRFLLGATYRDLWVAPITVPVLDLRRFAGGLTPTKTGGGNQTKSLRFAAAEGGDYVFRLVDKDHAAVPHGFEGSVVESIARDQVSAQHPAGAVVAAPLLRAAGILHATPILAVLPDDSLLGKFRADFAGKLGIIEEYPSTPSEGMGFGGALEIIESDSLRRLLDTDPSVRIDARGYLAARLMDSFLNDWDRHAGNWKWARMESTAEAPWVPIARDRDKVFISYGGLVRVAGKVASNMMTFRGNYPAVRGLTWNSLELDRRLLVPLEKPVWDSVAVALQAKITDQVIDTAVSALPRGYQHSGPVLAATLRQRRDRLPEIASLFYELLAAGPDIHATDAADRASVIREDDGSVVVELQSGSTPPWFRRRFHRSETDEIRLYLHGGDDRAVVSGNVSRSMPIRIIGGNGTNELIDSSRVGGQPTRARFYDAGTVSTVEYGPDTLFNRRPWVRSGNVLVAPGRDRGSSMVPVFGLSAPGDLGLVIRVGVNQSRYGFRVRPYAARSTLAAEYATGVSGWRVTGSVDRRREGTRVHFTGRVRMSELEVINFHGLGNATAILPTGSFGVEQRQWLFQPSIAVAVGPRSDLSFGPVLQYSTTGSVRNSFITANRPYGFGDFGQAGLRLGLSYELRDQVNGSRNGLLLDLSGSWFPGIWDVTTAFGALTAGAATFATIPLPLRPVLVLRANVQKLFGEFPFHESAFVGGRGSVRDLDLQRYAGDASFGGSTELQVPVGRVPLILPLDLGMYGYADAGRVYLDGTSPGGWHTGAGVGFWVGILTPATALNFELGEAEGRTRFRVKTGVSF